VFPILTAAVVPSVPFAPEGAPDAAVQQPQDGAFVEAVERAFARGGSRQSARAAAPDEANAADPTASAWAAGLNFQPARLAPIAAEQAPPSVAGGVEGEILWRAAGSSFPGATAPQASFGGAAHSLRMAGLSGPASPATTAGAAGQAAGIAGAMGGMIPSGAEMNPVPTDSGKAVPEERPAPTGFLQGEAALQPGNGATNDTTASVETEKPVIHRFGAGAAQAKAARTAAKAKAAPLQEAADLRQAGAAGLQAGAVWAADDRMAEAATAQQSNTSPEAAAVQQTSALPGTATVQHTNTRPEAVTIQQASAQPEAATAREISAPREKAIVLTEDAAAPRTSARPAAAAEGANAPQQIAAQAANARTDAAALPAADIAEMAAQAPNAGAAPEPATAARRAERKGTDAARVIGAQPRDSAAQDGQIARTQAAARQQNVYKGQAPKPEPDAERDQDAARSRPAGGRQQAVPGAFPTVGEGPGSPPAEQAAAPAPADSQRGSFDPNPAMQLARAALGAVRRGETRFHLKLRPEGVGEVAVTISARDNDLRLTIRAGSESTKDLILSQIGGLKQELTQGGYRLEGFSVDVSGGQGGQGGQASASRQDPGNQPERRPDARPEPKSVTPAPKEARFVRVPEARAGSINVRI
jgi:flagellar hook-length control protein FliK